MVLCHMKFRYIQLNMLTDLRGVVRKRDTIESIDLSGRAREALARLDPRRL